MKGYRYELYIDNEYQGCGIFQGMEYIEKSRIIQSLFKELPIPPSNVFANTCQTTSFFTEKGKEKFKDSITIAKSIYEEDLFNVRELIADVDEHDIVYQDKYQFIRKDF